MRRVAVWSLLRLARWMFGDHWAAVTRWWCLAFAWTNGTSQTSVDDHRVWMGLQVGHLWILLCLQGHLGITQYNLRQDKTRLPSNWDYVSQINWMTRNQFMTTSWIVRRGCVFVYLFTPGKKFCCTWPANGKHSWSLLTFSRHFKLLASLTWWIVFCYIYTKLMVCSDCQICALDSSVLPVRDVES